jgi:hypothetical protein
MSSLSSIQESDRAIGGACHGLAASPPRAVATSDAHGLGLADLADSLLEPRK